MTDRKYSRKQCMAALGLSPRLDRAVASGLTKVRPEHHELLRECAGYLELDGVMDSTMLVCQSLRSRRARRQFATEQREEAIFRLQEAGIIPIAPMWFSSAWFVLRWVIIPFIQFLLERQGGVDDAEND